MSSTSHNNPLNNKSFKFKGSNQRLISADITYGNHQTSVPICVFVHGFKGFKDWGAWPLAAEIFALKQIPFFKFNFSHNGTTPSNPTEFVDLEAFGNNNFKIEYDEIGTVLDFIEKKADSFDFEWNQKIFLIGHSRGGAMSLVRAANDSRISKCATWAGVSDLSKYMRMKDLTDWKTEGKHVVLNGRTGQEMPIYYQFVEAYQQNRELFEMEDVFEKIVCPLLIVHGEDDETVPLSEGQAVFNEVGHSILVEVEEANHTFNTKHPLEERKIPKAFAEVVTETIEFFNL